MKIYNLVDLENNFQVKQFAQIINKNRNAIIDEIINIYGEKYRNYITKKYDKICYVLHTDENSLKDYLERYLFNKRKVIIEEFIKDAKLGNGKFYKYEHEIHYENNKIKKIINELFGRYFLSEFEYQKISINSKVMNYDKIVQDAYEKAIIKNNNIEYNLLTFILKKLWEKIHQLSEEEKEDVHLILGIISHNLETFNLCKNVVLYENDINCYCTSIPVNLNDDINYTKICINPYACNDEMLIHEIIHAMTGKLLCVIDDKFLEKNGLHKPQDNKTIKLNEILTEFIAKKIRDNLHKKKIFLIDNEISGVSIYYKRMYLIEPLMDKYRNVIYEASISDNYNYLIETLGKDIYDKIINLFNNLDFDKYENERQKNINLLRLKYYLLLSKKNKILERVRSKFNK